MILPLGTTTRITGLLASALRLREPATELVIRQRNEYPKRVRLMSDETSPLCGWFRIVTATLRREDQFLQRYFQPYAEGVYKDWPSGIIITYETTISYILMRELWSSGYPKAVVWEYPYPGDNRKKVDLAIFDQRPEESIKDCSPDHVIEVKKVWFGYESKRKHVWKDIFKLLRFENVCHRHVLLMIFGSAGATLNDEVLMLQDGRLGNQEEECTRDRLIERLIPNAQERPWYAQHFDKVNEILWDEFETRVMENKPGRVRISLLEVHRRD